MLHATPCDVADNMTALRLRYRYVAAFCHVVIQVPRAYCLITNHPDIESSNPPLGLLILCNTMYTSVVSYASRVGSANSIAAPDAL